ncbi:DMT family transporter [Fuscibacter oryzae]|uniref:DMT family transporter n=1 Tax=Fuscibacter oryzae TaxID=2803939 RepID=A0A8J7MSL1_9RHOB|nr:DMT family transporter [Fuscibacter oryzae]MBL4929568.1 DMT family transporter [Fuscibacter oryzae]
MTPNNRRGIWLMVATVFAFACQDGFSRHLAGTYNTLMVVMLRYWVFAAFVLVLALRRPEGFRAAVRSDHMPMHVVRGALLVAEIAIIVWGYTLIGLIESHAVFAICPLLVVALSGPVLGERITPRRWVAVGVGLLGVLVILRPGGGVFSWPALLPMISAILFAIYSVLTRLGARAERMFPNFFWPAIIGAFLITFLGLPNWQPVARFDWLLIAGYAAAAVASNWLMLKTYEAAEASAVQPFAYMHIVFASIIALVVFGEHLAPAVALGAAIVVASGLFALISERKPANG